MMRATRPLFTALTAALLFAVALTIAPPATPALNPPASNQQAPLNTSTITTTPTGCDGWSEAAPYPIPIQGNAVVSLGGYIYSFGGSDQYTPTTAAYKFDGNTWAAIASLPVSRTFASAVSDGTYIYIINGTGPYTNHGTETNTVYRYDPAANTYTSLAPDLYATANQAAVYLDGSIFRIGGISRVYILIQGNVDIPISSVDVYIVASNSWITASNYPYTIIDEMAVAENGHILVAGGNPGDHYGNPDLPITKTYSYDLSSNLWDDGAIADMPSERAAVPAAMLSGRWIIAAGDSSPLLGWNPALNTWTNATASLTQTVFYGGGATLNGSFYIVGGGDRQQGHTNTWVYSNSCPPSLTPTGTPPTPTPSPTPPCQIWQQQPAYPYPTSANAVVSLNGYLYSFGGLADMGYTPHSYKYDGHSWTQIADPPTYISDASAVTDGTYAYILNGYAYPPGGVTRKLYRYDPASDSYTALASPQFATADQAAVYLNGKIYRIGGAPTAQHNVFTNTVEVYNVGANTWSRVADYPIEVAAEAAIALNGYIYAAGGFTSGGQSGSKTYRYSPNTDTWDDAAIADLPTARFLNASGIYNGQWLLASSISGHTVDSSTTNWNPNTNTWQTAANMVVPRLWMGGATLGNSFYAIGGVGFVYGGGALSTNDNQRYTNTCPTPTPTPTLCPVPFGDISGDLFYAAIGALYCSGAVSGTDATHYSPAGTSTRGQFARVVVKGFGLPITTPTSGQQSFTDVPPGYFAYHYIETGLAAGILSGYTADQCAAAGAAFPCYLPNRPITRAELTKLAVKAAGYPRITPTSGPTFVDVPASYFAYTYIETAYAHGIIRGTDATHFQPARNIRRDEMAQIVFKAVTTP